MLTDGYKGQSITPEMIAAIADEGRCAFSSILHSGKLHFDGAIAEETIPALHATFHSLAALILTLVTSKTESREIGSYMTALNNASNELLVLLKVARVQPE